MSATNPFDEPYYSRLDSRMLSLRAPGPLSPEERFIREIQRLAYESGGLAHQTRWRKVQSPSGYREFVDIEVEFRGDKPSEDSLTKWTQGRMRTYLQTMEHIRDLAERACKEKDITTPEVLVELLAILEKHDNELAG